MRKAEWAAALARLAAGVLFLSAAFARAQMMVPSDINLFGDPAALQTQRPPTASSPAAAPAPYSQTLVFSDGRELRGELVEINNDNIVWRRADTNEPLRFARGEVRRFLTEAAAQQSRIAFPGGRVVGVRVAGKTGTAQRTNDEAIPATLKLPGGDWLFGNVTSADGQAFELRLDAETTLTIGRPQIEWIHFAKYPVPAFGFSGAALDMEGWLPGAAGMEVTGNTLTVRGASWIGRKIAPPKRFEVDFELPEDGEEGTRLWLQPFGPQPNCYGTGTAEIRFGKKEITKLLFVNNFDRQPEPLPKAALEDKGPPKYRVFYDDMEKRIIVLRNGRSVGDWRFFEKKDGQVEEGNRNFQFNGICFDREDRGEGPTPLRLNRLRILPWDGHLPKEGERDEGQDRMSSVDAAPVAGKLESISEKEFGFSGAPQVRQASAFIQLSGAAPASLAGAEAKLEFGNRGEFAARHLEIRDGKLHCETAFASTLEFPVSTLQRISFQAQPPAGPAPADMLVFKNGDELPGKAISASAPGNVRWRTVSGQEVEIQTARIAGLRLGGASAAKKTSPEAATATLELRSGERLRGKLLGFDDKQLRVDHPLFGSITLARDRLWHLFPNPGMGVMDGGTAPQDWIRSYADSQPPGARTKSAGPDRWVFLDGTYVLRSDGNTAAFSSAELPGLQREINPALQRFEVRIEGAALLRAAPNFLMTLMGKNGASLNATLSYSQLQVVVMGANQQRQSRWREIPLEEKIGSANPLRAVRLFVDTGAGTCDMVINDVLIARLGQADDELLSKSSYTLRIQPYPNQGSPSIFSNIWIGPWNGDLPLTGNGTTGCTELANGDIIPTTPKLLQDGKLKIDSELGELELPVEKTLDVDFGGGPDKQPAAARFRFGDGTVVNVDGFTWDGLEFKAHSAWLGDLRLPADAVSELIFDPALPRPPASTVSKKRLQKDSEKNGNPRILP